MLLFIDSCDHYSATEVGYKWSSTTGSLEIASAYGRFGNGIRSGFGGGTLAKTIGATATIITGFAEKVTSLANRTLLTLMDGASNQIILYMNSTGTLSVWNGAVGGLYGTLLGTSSSVIKINTWHHYEIKVTIHASAGIVELRVDGTTFLSLSGVDTQYTANATVDRLLYNVDLTQYIDDIYICNGVGTANNDFLGDCRVECVFPDGDGSSLNFTPSTGADHYAMVDEVTPNSDTDYNSSGSPGDKDFLTFDSLSSSSGSVFGVQLSAWCKKSDAGARYGELLTYSGSTEESGGSFGLPTSYTYQIEMFETEPSTGDPWSIESVNDAEFGYGVYS